MHEVSSGLAAASVSTELRSSIDSVRYFRFFVLFPVLMHHSIYSYSFIWSILGIVKPEKKAWNDVDKRILNKKKKKNKKNKNKDNNNKK